MNNTVTKRLAVFMGPIALGLAINLLVGSEWRPIAFPPAAIAALLWIRAGGTQLLTGILLSLSFEFYFLGIPALAPFLTLAAIGLAMWGFIESRS